MGKIKKIREQKKIDALQKDEERRRRNRSIIIGLVVGLLVLVFLIFAIVKFLNWKIGSSSTPTPTATPSVSATPASIFPSMTPTFSVNPEKLAGQVAVIETDRGVIKLELFAKDAPKTAANFADLIKKGFYNGLKFHRVVPGFVIQGGDPNGDGSGGPGYKFEDEINPWSLGLSEKVIKSYQALGYQYRQDLTSHKMEAGMLAMANSGPNTNGSQFFIVTDQAQPHLDGKHTVFGRVISGMDVVKKIQQEDIIKKITLSNK